MESSIFKSEDIREIMKYIIDRTDSESQEEEPEDFQVVWETYPRYIYIYIDIFGEYEVFGDENKNQGISGECLGRFRDLYELLGFLSEMYIKTEYSNIGLKA